ncbi:MAG: proliferating cell nuclear antigen (pcna) [Candidatus Woesearchaeota archaeon]
MKLTLAEPKYLKDSISIISELITEARFTVTKQSMKLVAMDPANVAMVIFELFSSSFTEYNLEKDTEFSINLNYFKQILRRAGSSDTLTLELKESKLNVILKGSSKRKFSMSVLEAEDKEQKIPTLEFAASITVPCATLSNVVEDAAVINADSVSFMSDDKKATFIAESDLNKVDIELEPSDEITIKNESGESVKAKYSIEYLKKMVSGSKLSETVRINFGKDYPLKLEYVSVDKVRLEFVLAPRVEND